MDDLEGADHTSVQDVEIAPLQLEIRTLPKGGEAAGERITLAVPSDTLVGALKQRVCSQRTSERWDAANMNLILQGRFLAEERTLAECGLRDGDFLVATGMTSFTPSNKGSFAADVPIGGPTYALPAAQELERA
uniref:Ubiquitin-like domain-containing protein n=1 Tax=Calcidiscus leptoporus TaxID=127549 RepID=A0A7S0P5H2_9EUKA|mmetsp:Transcript_7210/g.16879  ORF Transcript_7210/g.16879 Transcript_7210/m.16879 type:complete len:134 (+) Transcript_7210:65-466(+)|eukprot:CAMPEP_0119380768 /NCGR_PEP_ID=MMETSP1334-20130426/57916_1 /TAXON_ID=127549 /ORGANISM="Calcidiscus leptoporus, Strain RCC1130" /LENGTH=133 /DNA_ID=CAMNT_0007400703 /DNA_START=64 /DNA_END=465 /DNA_ORIENTATION=-